MMKQDEGVRTKNNMDSLHQGENKDMSFVSAFPASSYFRDGCSL